MSDKSTLFDLYSAIAVELKRRIDDGSATAADLSAAIKFLKDNNIDVDAMKNPETASLAAKFELPFGDDEAVDELRC